MLAVSTTSLAWPVKQSDKSPILTWANQAKVANWPLWPIRLGGMVIGSVFIGAIRSHDFHLASRLGAFA